MKNNDITKAVKLTSDALDSVSERLKNLVAKNVNIPTLAYAGASNSGPRCGCKGSCDGGCTSW